MDVMVLKQRPTAITPINLYSDSEPTAEQNDHELALMLGEETDGETRDQEIQSYIARIKILESELQKARTEAYKTAYQEGRTLAKNEAGKQIDKMSNQFANNISTIHSEFKDTLIKLSEPLLRLVFGISEKLVRRDLALDKRASDLLKNQVQNVLNETITQSRHVVQVNPLQLEWISGADLLDTLNIHQKGNLRFTLNSELTPGECKLETEDYLIDSTIATQLEVLEKALIESHA